jgi:very-short-patch-repair endonuclease
MSKKFEIEKDYLYDLYINQNLKTIDIAKMFNVSRKTIHMRLREYKIYKSKDKINENIKKTCQEKYGVDFPLQNNNIRNKASNTYLKKNGYGSPLSDPNVRIKIEKTCQEKYGVSCTLKAEEIINQIKETNLKNYGYENPFSNENIKEKIKETNLEKYGSEYIGGSEIIKEKCSKTQLEKSFYLLIGKVKDYLIPLFNVDDYYIFRKYKNSSLLWKCKKCGKEFHNSSVQHLPICRKCYPPLIGTSSMEQELYNILIDHNIICNKRFFEQGKYKYEIDLYLIDYNIGIELDGLYWHSELGGGKQKFYHLDKTNYFKNKNIDILHFWETEWRHKKDIVLSIIKNKIGKSKKIYGRKCTIKEVSSNDSRNFLDNNHLQGNVNSAIKIGLYYNNELVSLFTMGKPRMNKNYEYELLRFCNKLNYTVIGGFSKLLKYFIINYKPKNIITYADRRYSLGNLYSKNGFEFIRETNPNYYYMFDYTVIETRHKYQKHKLNNILETFDSNKTEWDNMQLNGYDRIWDCGNLVFVLNNP